MAIDTSCCAALSGLLALVILNPGLTPWAFLLDPFGVLSFAPGTNEASGRHWHAATFSGGQENQVHSPIYFLHYPSSEEVSLSQFRPKLAGVEELKCIDPQLA